MEVASSMAKRLSILIPVYNVENYISRCLNSMLSQNEEGIEILLGDDGSKDGSGKICDLYAERHGNIKVFHNQNLGAGAERNFLVDRAQGDYIWFVDADDFIEPNSIQALLTVADTHPEAEMITMAFCMVDANGKKGDFWDMPNKPLRMSGKEALQRGLFTGYIWEKLYRRDYLNKYNIRFHEELTNQEDLVFNILALSKCRSIFQSDIFGYNYFSGNPNSTLHDNSLDTQKRNVHNTLIAQQEILRIIHGTSDSEIQQAIYRLLNFNAGGLLYAMYVMKYPIAETKRAIAAMRKNKLYPVGRGSNKKANLFVKFANVRLLYLAVCRVHKLL